MLNPALITCNHMFHPAHPQFFLATRNKSQFSSLTVFKSWNEEPSKLRLSTFSTSHAESYGQMILKYPELEQVVEQWCDDLFEPWLWLYSPSPLYKCSMVVQREEAMQWFLCLWRRPYVKRRLLYLQAVRLPCTLCASTSPSPLQISLTDNKILSHLSVHFSHLFFKVQICAT